MKISEALEVLTQTELPKKYRKVMKGGKHDKKGKMPWTKLMSKNVSAGNVEASADRGDKDKGSWDSEWS